MVGRRRDPFPRDKYGLPIVFSWQDRAFAVCSWRPPMNCLPAYGSVGWCRSGRIRPWVREAPLPASDPEFYLRGEKDQMSFLWQDGGKDFTYI